MNKDAILAFVKKNTLSLTCGLVALLAVVAVFYPLGGWFEDLRHQAEAQAGFASTISGLNSKPRKKPVVDIDASDPGTLTGYSTQNTIKAGKDAVDMFKNMSDLTVKNLVEQNRLAHPLLVSDVLPVPKNQPHVFDFARLYRLALSTDQTITGKGTQAVNDANSDCKLLNSYNDLNLQNDILMGAMPPSQADIDKKAYDLWYNDRDGFHLQVAIINNKEDPDSMAEVAARYNVIKAGLPAAMKNDVAQRTKVYVNPDAFNTNPKIDSKEINGGNGPSPEEIWYSQMQVWIDQDVARAIADANAKSRNVLEAPVKRLLGVVIPPTLYSKQPAVTGANGAVAAPLAQNDASPITPNYAHSVSGRYCNPMYDVVEFTVYVDVDASRVNEFLETLSNNRMITVTGQNLWNVNSDFESRSGFLYGPATVVRLQLTCESLFFRGWTVGPPPPPAGAPVPLNQPVYPMPDSVQIYLDIKAPPAGAVPGAGGMGGGVGPGGGGPPNPFGGGGGMGMPPMR